MFASSCKIQKKVLIFFVVVRVRIDEIQWKLEVTTICVKKTLHIYLKV